ncbi:MAG: hypothetical protein KC777_02140 [Cyanobacteria bacterium HKST-UBA02]|nr:hypothetical protein [Cyanobacteria bacterium HKST-UBA02]
MLNLKLRLEKLCDTRSWVRLHFADGTTLTGRVLRVGHDYVEMESYGDPDRPYDNDYARHLVPLNLVKVITIESSSFAEAERRRLSYMASLESPDGLPEIEK